MTSLNGYAPPDLQLCLPPVPILWNAIDAMPEAEARRLLRVMVLEQPDAFESYVRISQEERTRTEGPA